MTAARLSITVNSGDRDVPADVSIAAALLEAGDRVAVFCGMGSCHACALTVDGVQGVRGCITPVRAGMTIETGKGSDA